jgi:hypothetical protein
MMVLIRAIAIFEVCNQQRIWLFDLNLRQISTLAAKDEVRFTSKAVPI